MQFWHLESEQIYVQVSMLQVGPDLNGNGNAYHLRVKEVLIFWDVTRKKIHKSLAMLHTHLKLKSFKQSSENNRT